MMADDEFPAMTTSAHVDIYKNTKPIFEGVMKEVRELSRKKPEATMSASKVKLVNRILSDLLVVLKDEPIGKYLSELDDSSLPQMSDAVLSMVQFESALNAYSSKYHKYFSDVEEWLWLTEETKDRLEHWDDDDEDDEAEEEDLEIEGKGEPTSDDDDGEY